VAQKSLVLIFDEAGCVKLPNIWMTIVDAEKKNPQSIRTYQLSVSVEILPATARTRLDVQDPRDHAGTARRVRP
jgi:hypothetical protein